MAHTVTRIGIYARSRMTRTASKPATVRQLQDARLHAERNGWEVVDVFKDIDLFAFNTKVRRPEFERMVTMLRAGDIDGVLTWKLEMKEAFQGWASTTVTSPTSGSRSSVRPSKPEMDRFRLAVEKGNAECHGCW